jgi:hypothetical protein
LINTNTDFFAGSHDKIAEVYLWLLYVFCRGSRRSIRDCAD